MTPERYAEIQAEFLRLRELLPDQRVEALANVDQELRADVESLLQSEADCTQQFLEPKAVAVECDQGTPDSPTNAFEYDESAPERVGRYRLLQKIGEGGHGAVYMAEQQEPVRRKVAVKLIKPGMDSKQVLARFHAEQQALAMMDHPSIAKILDAGLTESGTPYFVMDLVRGAPIHEFCDATQASLDERLQLFLQVCDAIHHAHRRGIIHRDIKPTNVLVTMTEDEPLAKVIDFGIAKALDSRLTQRTLFTEFGTMIGTLEYMSPEQAEMSAVEVDTRSDVYSLGVLLYQLLTGEPPITREQLLAKGVFEVPRLLRDTEPKSPSDRITHRQRQLASVDRNAQPQGLRALPRGDLDWITLRALAKDRRRRYESVLDLARDVRRYLAGEAVMAHPPSFVYKARKIWQRNRLPIVTSVFLLTGALFGLVGIIGGWQSARRAARAAEHQHALAVQAQQAADRNARDLAESVYSELIDSAWRSASQHRNQRAKELLATCLPELRGWEWSFVSRQIAANDAHLFRAEKETAVREMDVCTARHQIAFRLQGGDIEVWDLQSRSLHKHLDMNNQVNVVRWSRDGAMIFVGTGQGQIQVLSTETWEPLLTHEQRLGGVYDIAVSRDGKYIADCTGNSQVELFELDPVGGRLTSKRRWKIASRLTSLDFLNDEDLVGAGYDGNAYVFDSGEEQVERIEVSKSTVSHVLTLDVRRFAAMSGQALVFVEDLDSNAKLSVDRSQTLSALAWDGVDTLAVGAGDGNLSFKNISQDESLTANSRFGSAVNDVVWWPDEEAFLVALSDGRVVWVTAPDQSNSDLDNQPATAGILLDERQLAIGGDGSGWVRSFRLASGELQRELRAHQSAVWSVATDASESLLVTAGEDLKACCWRLPDLQLLREDKITWGARDVCVAPDGSWYASAPPPVEGRQPREGTVAIRDFETGKVLRLLEGHENWVIKMAVSDGGQTLATSGVAPHTRLWDVTTGEQELQLSYPTRAAAEHLVFDEMNDRIFLGHQDGWVTTWSLENGSCISSWPAFGDAISGLTLTEDYRILASSQSSPLLKVRDTKTQRTVASLDLGFGFLVRMQRSTQGHHLALVGEERELQLMEISLRATQ